jgi:hypothetical protein
VMEIISVEAVTGVLDELLALPREARLA